jgi:hypothetical protein
LGHAGRANWTNRFLLAALSPQAMIYNSFNEIRMRITHAKLPLTTLNEPLETGNLARSPLIRVGLRPFFVS